MSGQKMNWDRAKKRKLDLTPQKTEPIHGQSHIRREPVRTLSPAELAALQEKLNRR